MNKLKPIRISGWVSLQHTVKVLPGQDVILELDRRHYASPRLEINGKYISWIKISEDEGKFVFKIIQKENLEPWADVSCTFLGEVWIESEENFGRLEVIQQCQNLNPSRKNTLTLINPSSIDVKVKPHNILEIVLYDELHNPDTWEWQWHGFQDVDVELLAYKRFTLASSSYESDFLENINGPEIVFPWYPRIKLEQGIGYQHHFWFRLSKNASMAFDLLDSKTTIGDFWFYGFNQNHSERLVTHFFSLHGDFHNVDFEKFEATQKIPAMNLSNSFKRSLKPKLFCVNVSEIDPTPMEFGCQTLPAIPSQATKHLMGYFGHQSEFSSCLF